MRQQFSIVQIQTPRQRSERMKRNRRIRKQKLFECGYTDIDPSECTMPLKQEKIHAQKIKNRQAAQKSREIKKNQMSELEAEIRYLKDKISSMRYCENCQKEIQNSEDSNFEISNTTREETNSSVNSPQNQSFAQPLESPESLDFENQNESYFVRMSNSNEDSSIGIYLFIFMIVVGIFCFGSRMDGSEGPMRRDLTQFYREQSLSETIQSDGGFDMPKKLEFQINQSPTYSTANLPETENYDKGLVSTAWNARHDQQIDAKCLNEIVRSFENYKVDNFEENNLRSTMNYIESNKSLLFCSSPKIYHSSQNSEGILTAFMDIFVQGAEIINLLPALAHEGSGLSSGLHLEGLYKITTSVEGIVEVPLESLNSAYN